MWNRGGGRRSSGFGAGGGGLRLTGEGAVSTRGGGVSLAFVPGSAPGSQTLGVGQSPQGLLCACLLSGPPGTRLPGAAVLTRDRTPQHTPPETLPEGRVESALTGFASHHGRLSPGQGRTVDSRL